MKLASFLALFFISHEIRAKSFITSIRERNQSRWRFDRSKTYIEKKLNLKN
jgi:hypothetical protein